MEQADKEVAMTGSVFKMWLWLFVLIIFNTQQSWSQLSFTAQSDFSSVPLHKKFNVTFILKGGSAEQFTQPSFGGFRVIGQQSFTGGGNFQVIINGKIVNSGSGESKWIFTLQPQKTGTYTIGPAKVVSGGKTYQSNSITIKVTDGGSAVPNQQQTTGSNTSPTNSSQQTDEGKQLFLRAVPSSNRIYKGQQITVSYRLYTLLDITQYGISKTATMDGFWTEDLTDINTHAKTWQETVDGKTYMVAEIRTIALIPQKSGLLTVPPLQLEAIVQIPNRQAVNPFSIFDQFFKDPISAMNQGFGYRTEKRTINGNELQITVLDLPNNGKSEQFNGAVGRFSVEAEADRNSCQAGDAVTLTIRVKGGGNIPLLEWPELHLPEGMESYEPDIRDEFQRSSEGISGTRTFEFLIQPSLPGTFQLEPGTLHFFDPLAGVYDSVSLQSISLEVKPGKGGTISSTQKEDDIRHIASSISPGMLLMPGLVPFGLYLSSLLVVFSALLFIFRRRIKLRSDPEGFRMKMALRTARKRLRKASQLLMENNDDAYYTELSRALWLFITDKYAIPFSELTLKNAHQTLLAGNVPEKTANAFSEILNECEYARFAPDKGTSNKHWLFERSSDLIVKVQTRSEI